MSVKSVADRLLFYVLPMRSLAINTQELALSQKVSLARIDAILQLFLESSYAIIID